MGPTHTNLEPGPHVRLLKFSAWIEGGPKRTNLDPGPHVFLLLFFLEFFRLY